ncbi:MAG: hypothetical protein ACFFAH_03665 [Promethearchaeota archaeon]
MVKVFDELFLTEEEDRLNLKKPKILTADHFNEKNKIIKWRRQYKNKVYKKYSSWILAGSGNFKLTKDDGRYRMSCNTYRNAYTCENHPIKSMKIGLNHCNKFDCETCYTYTASNRALRISETMEALKGEAKKENINIGRIKHIMLMPKKISLLLFINYDKFLKFRRKVKKMLQECGIFAFAIFTHLWVLRCTNCGNEENICKCQEKDIFWELNPHFHVIGFGYMLNNQEFRKKFNYWIYRKFPDRKNIKDAYNTVFYVLTHCALWKKPDGNLKPAYKDYGYLEVKELVTTRKRIKYKVHTCRYCKNTLREVVAGITPKGDQPNFRDDMSLLYKAKQLGVKKKGLKEKEMYRKLAQYVYNNDNFKLEVVEQDLKLGKKVMAKKIVREYRIKDIDGLRRIVKENHRRYREDKKKWNQNKKESNGYG